MTFWVNTLFAVCTNYSVVGSSVISVTNPQLWAAALMHVDSNYTLKYLNNFHKLWPWLECWTMSVFCLHLLCFCLKIQPHNLQLMLYGYKISIGSIQSIVNLIQADVFTMGVISIQHKINGMWQSCWVNVSIISCRTSIELHSIECHSADGNHLKI